MGPERQRVVLTTFDRPRSFEAGLGSLIGIGVEASNIGIAGRASVIESAARSIGSARVPGSPLFDGLRLCLPM